MKKKIELSGRWLEYELRRKKVKNINLRIKPEGVFVSANRLVPQSSIDAFLKDRAELIFSAVDRLSGMEKPGFEDGSKVSLLGREYVLKLVEAEKNSFYLEEDSIILFLKDREQAGKVLDSLFRKQAEQLFPRRCQLLCEKMMRQMPQIKYRAMKSRWGSCTPAKNSICLNTRLITAPLSCVDFVIAHELCHFLRADHSAAFYRELEKIMPDWKARKKQLSEYGKYLQ